MVRKDLLTSIWSGHIQVCVGEDRSPLAVLLDGVLSVPTVSLTLSDGLERPTAFADSTELLPGVQLGDVLAEELGFDIPVNSIILIEPAHLAGAATFSEADLGRDLGHVLTSVASGSLNQCATRPMSAMGDRAQADAAVQLATR